MSSPENPNQDFTDRANEVTTEAIEFAITGLAKDAVKEAESYTYMDGVIWPDGLVKSAEAITIQTGDVEPAQVLKAANAITTYAAEVSAVGEDLKPYEEPADEDSFNDIYKFLNLSTQKRAYAQQNAATRAAMKYEQGKQDKQDPQAPSSQV